MTLPIAVMLSNWQEHQAYIEYTNYNNYGNGLLQIYPYNPPQMNVYQFGQHPQVPFRNFNHAPPNRPRYLMKQHQFHQNVAFTSKAQELFQKVELLNESELFRRSQELSNEGGCINNQSFTNSPPTSKLNDRKPPPSSGPTSHPNEKHNFHNSSKKVNQAQHSGYTRSSAKSINKLRAAHQRILPREVPIPEETPKKTEIPECDLSIDQLIEEMRNEVESTTKNSQEAPTSSSLLEAIEDANEKLGFLTNGHTLNTINPFTFFDAKDFEEELIVHRALHASRVVFPISEGEEKECSGEKKNPEQVQITKDLLKKAESSKLSVNAEPFKFNPPASRAILGQKKGKEVFLDFVSRIDKNTMRSLAPLESSSVPLFAQEVEVEDIPIQDFQRNITEQTRPEEIGDVDELEGEELTPEDLERAQSSCLGAIGTEVNEEGEEVPLPKVPPVELVVMYEGRNILDLAANLRDEFFEMERWQLGPPPMIAMMEMQNNAEEMDEHPDAPQDPYPYLPPYKE